ncbi:GLPGLI family protein [Pedobacter roseus]|uniref:GLPGLI family protein n=1 Tax=Pedobacter roseus TaxID=336820 RepID=A0A7G9QBI8_9SPHI|nr:GLPGLI family protein [Pedobacter roseus]QNN40713.1 GLPGLI family protein [Pedobacter roseus]
MVFKKCLLNFSLLIFLLYSFCAKAQRGTVNYKLTINEKNLGKKMEQNLIIYFDKLNSVELRVKPKNPAGNIPIDDLNQVKVLKSGKPTFVFKDFSRKKLLLSDYVGTKKVILKDTLNNFKWKILKEKKKIGSFNCIKAETAFRGRLYEAWYTENIPIQNGPWKFCGLPGLIVMVRDTKSDFVYELTGIDLNAKFENKIIGVPVAYEKDKVVTYKEFRILYKKKLEDYIRLSRVEQTTPDGITGTINIHMPEKQEKF